MHVRVDARKNRTEGHTILDVMNVGTAADGHRLTLETSHLLIGTKQLLNEFTVCSHSVWRNHTRGLEVEAMGMRRLLRCILTVFLRRHHRCTAVELHLDIARIHMIEVRCTGQCMGLRILHLDTEVRTVGLRPREDLQHSLNRIDLCTGSERKLRRQDHRSETCVLTTLWGRRMCRYTDDGDFIHTGLCALYAAELADLVHRCLCEVHIETLETKGRLLRNGIQCKTCLE